MDRIKLDAVAKKFACSDCKLKMAEKSYQNHERYYCGKTEVETEASKKKNRERNTNAGRRKNRLDLIDFKNNKIIDNIQL